MAQGHVPKAQGYYFFVDLNLSTASLLASCYPSVGCDIAPPVAHPVPERQGSN